MIGGETVRPGEVPSAKLRRLAAPIWTAQLAHPFVQGIGDGTLDPALFGFWLRQDYLFLLDYARVFAFAAARAPDEATMTRFADLMHETLHGELDLHRSYAAEFGITMADLERETTAPTTRGYSDFLVRTAATAPPPEVYAALLPCMWGYSWLGQQLAAQGLPADERYARWIESYASEEFAELATWCRDLLDTTVAGLDATALGRVETAFLTSSRYELAFWEMAWRRETWVSPPGGPEAPAPACASCKATLTEPFGWCGNCQAAFCFPCGRLHFCQPTCQAQGCHAGLCVREVREGRLSETWGLPAATSD